MIIVKNLSKNFQTYKKEPGLLGSIKSLFRRKTITKEALKDISFQINEGEIVGLVGANGAGKTTLTKILAGIIHPTSGIVSVHGMNPWKRENSYRKSMSLIMGQKAQLWWDLPAADSFLLLKEIYKIPDAKFDSTLNELTSLLEVENLIKIPLRKLSLGERMKIELIAALLHEPKVIYLDEPTIGLDITAQKSIRHFLKNYKNKFKPIIILTSHYMQDIQELCPRIIVLNSGSIVFDGEVNKLRSFQKYKTIKFSLNQSLNCEDFPASLGRIQLSEDGFYILNTPKDKIQEATSYVLNNYSINDLSIQEEDISILIEELMKSH